ncbi:MAG: TIGR03084 family protein [Deltaproteobacteria bacterium]|nr:TIGR03084 family protein [Deltaproteobacteria bacterium]
MKEICKDLADECRALDIIIKDLDEAVWNRKTPFYDWTIKDEISHLAYFDRFVRLSASDKKAFERDMEYLAQNFEKMFEVTREEGLAMSASDLLQWWRTGYKAMVEAFSPLDPKTRLPWHLPMSARSSATARLMETWAHGQDIVDALGADRVATDRLRHIAHLGVATFGWSFSCRQMDVPEDPVRVELAAPSGTTWNWGPEDGQNMIKGPAEDFCLVVAQRRHFKDTNLKISGDTAGQWMSIAQVFAGPAALGPEPNVNVP